MRGLDKDERYVLDVIARRDFDAPEAPREAVNRCAARHLYLMTLERCENCGEIHYMPILMEEGEDGDHVRRRAENSGVLAMPLDDDKPIAPGYKRIPVTLIIHTYEDVPETNTEEHTKFWIEEHHCLGNYLTDIQEEEAEAAKEAGVKEPAGICKVCGYGRAFVGHLPFPESKR